MQCLTVVSVQGFDVDERGEACVKGAYENTGRSIKRPSFVQKGSKDLKTTKDNTLRVSKRARVLVMACLVIEKRRVSCAARFELCDVAKKDRNDGIVVGKY